MPKVSIIIPVYKRTNFLEWTVNSVRGQTSADWEIIMVDDGSGMAEVTASMEAIASLDERIRCVAMARNGGTARARNRGLEEASGDYVIFLDSDDVLLPWTLETLATVILQEGAPDIIVGSAVSVDGEHEAADTPPAPLSHTRHANYFDYRMACGEWWFVPSGAAVKLSALRAVGGFWACGDFCEDIDLWHRMGTCSGLVRIHAPVTYGYRLHGGGAHADFQKMYNGLERMIEAERRNDYPGGGNYRKARIDIIAGHARHHAFEFFATRSHLAWRLYRSSFLWNLQLARLKFLLGFPVLAALQSGGVRNSRIDGSRGHY